MAALAALAAKGITATGLDISPMQCEKARARWGHLPSSHFEHVDAPGYLTGSGQRWDAIYSVWGTAWFTDPEDLLPLVHDHLPPGGKLVFSHAPAVPGTYGVQGIYGADLTGPKVWLHRWSYEPATWSAKSAARSSSQTMSMTPEYEGALFPSLPSNIRTPVRVCRRSMTAFQRPHGHDSRSPAQGGRSADPKEPIGHFRHIGHTMLDMDLSGITREAVLDAIGECDRLGRDRFLERYGFERARRYFLRHDGVHYDSKAIVGVAHRHVTGRPLTAEQFSGGRQTVGRLLTRLGFEVIVDEPLPPQQRLLEILGALRAAGTPDGPARHQPITLLWALGRAAHHRPRLVSWRDAHPVLRGLMREYGQPSSRPTPEFPILALARTELWELQGHVGAIPPAHGKPITWLEEQNPFCGLTGWAYELVAFSESAREEAIKVLGSRFFDGSVPEGLLEEVGLRMEQRTVTTPPQEPSPLEVYHRLCWTVEEAEMRGDHDRTTHTEREQPVRSSAAVKAVLIRSGGRCENPRCAGQPDDVTKDGDPILEVDHVHDRAKGGRDHPIQMIALCPNCHAIKTRGRTSDQLRELLLSEARSRHSAWMP